MTNPIKEQLNDIERVIEEFENKGEIVWQRKKKEFYT